MSNKFQILLSLPKTIWFNFRHLPFRKAIKLPFYIHYSTDVKVDGKIILGDTSTAIVRYGFHDIPSKPKSKARLLVEGTLVVEGSAHIGMGSVIHIEKEGELILGDNFAISGCSTINCYKKITFGRDIQFAWDDLVMDSDTHTILDEDGNVCNEPREIVFGDKIWIGCRSTILKGTKIPSNCVIGACSFVSGDKFEENTIIVGSPAKSRKKIKGWEL